MTALRVLILEDEPFDEELLLRELGSSLFQVTHRRLADSRALRIAMTSESWDIILSDFNMPSFSALDALRIVQELKLDIPLIVVSGAIGEELAVELMKAGAEDYVMKSKLARLGPAIERSLKAVQTRRAEQQMRTAATLAARDRENMLAIVSHDLKNPLGAIRLNHQLMARIIGVEPVSEKEKKVLVQLERAQRSAGRMVSLIDDILDMAKIEAGRFIVEKAESNPDELLSEVIELHQHAAIQKSILLETQVSDKECMAFFDHARMFQVFSNLLGNAIKFTQEGGTVRVNLECTRERFFLAVADVGPGIQPEYLNHVFDRFYQVKDTARLGTGLGLSIAKGIVDAHGGKIWVESKVGEGSTFYVSLPGTDLG